MAYRKEMLTGEEAIQRVGFYPYALVYNMSSLYFGKVEEIGSLDWEECMEARFFSEQEELHLFHRGEQMVGAVIGDSDDQGVILRSYQLDAPWCSSYGKTVLVKEYLEEDEDGQVYVSATRLTR